MEKKHTFMIYQMIYYIVSIWDNDILVNGRLHNYMENHHFTAG